MRAPPSSATAVPAGLLSRGGPWGKPGPRSQAGAGGPSGVVVVGACGSADRRPAAALTATGLVLRLTSSAFGKLAEADRLGLCTKEQCSRLDSIVTTGKRRVVPFVPAHAEHFCVNCGFPFRNGPPQQYRREYDLKSNHGRCETRPTGCAGSGRWPAGQAQKTQQADPHAWATGQDAIAHAWVRQRYPHVNLADWQPYQLS